MGKNIGKNINLHLSDKYSQKRLDHTKQYAADPFKTAWKKEIQKTAESTDDLIGNKFADKITKFSKKSETVTNENDKEIPKERYISTKKCRKLLMN